ncbi:hypothetical protein CAOG_00395 [Capsaspora owczarzaki ATCC 30864]|uniref:NAD(+) kinase n=1 Tax=Capsaspora owczarzaki (strain ATCC 30864) TaxID=595528 RepID=A0A0D2X0C4_CAPO3|nr:hypothetical protein CAOG_00395 [Capsaspora owczarzaki ATCC 30864]KJE88814.1 hypothetical protein CAOG_000395 [Capsaspora owczarzaki ATCC 30864]|eukprot:XP_004365266.2 hypothetical protein CAOG_00395 [Capsaspora owczarzaki ATCC 30864]
MRRPASAALARLVAPTQQLLLSSHCASVVAASLSSSQYSLRSRQTDELLLRHRRWMHHDSSSTTQASTSGHVPEPPSQATSTQHNHQTRKATSSADEEAGAGQAAAFSLSTMLAERRAQSAAVEQELSTATTASSGYVQPTMIAAHPRKRAAAATAAAAPSPTSMQPAQSQAAQTADSDGKSPSQQQSRGLTLRNVLVVMKLSRLEYERQSHGNVSDAELAALLRKRGSDYDGLLFRHRLHIASIERLTSLLAARGVRYTLVSADEVRPSLFRPVSSWLSTSLSHSKEAQGAPSTFAATPSQVFDAVFSAGGDATFLRAAAHVTDQTPVIGLNTDPERSRGFLCLKVHDPVDVLDRLAEGNFSYLRRQRIRVRLSGELSTMAVAFQRHRHSYSLSFSGSKADSPANLTFETNPSPYLSGWTTGNVSSATQSLFASDTAVAAAASTTATTATAATSVDVTTSHAEIGPAAPPDVTEEDDEHVEHTLASKEQILSTTSPSGKPSTKEHTHGNAHAAKSNALPSNNRAADAGVLTSDSGSDMQSLNQHCVTLRYRALNEVIIAEADVSNAAYYELSVDGSPGEKQKSSGLIVSTGTGSTSWLYNVCRMNASDVTRILELAHCPQGRDPVHIAEQFNSALVFDPADPRLKFAVREPIDNGIFNVTHPRGFANTLSVRSRSIDARLILDSAVSIPFTDGAVATVEMHDEDALLTVVMDR